MRMSLRLCPVRRPFALCLPAVLVLLGSAAAQSPSLNDGLDALDKKYKEAKLQITALLRGEIQLEPGNAPHLEAMDLAAKYATYPYVLDVLETTPGQIDKIFHQRLENDLKYLRDSKEKTTEAAREYGKRVREHAMEVIRYDRAKPIAQVNAARTLARLAELAQPELVDPLAELARDSKMNGGVRYWAFRGLRDLLAQRTEDGPVVDKARIDKAAAAVVEFLKQKPLVDASLATREEIDGFRLLRREALRALAQTRLPVGTSKGPSPVLMLAQFAGNDRRISPLPRLDERLEAAIGLARMRSSKDNGLFQPDYAVWQIGLFLEVWGKTANDNREKKDRERVRPWKIDAARLTEVLEPLRVEVKDPYVAEGVRVANRIINAVNKGNVAAAEDLAWFDSHKPPNEQLFQGDKDAVVDPAEPEPFLPPPEKKSDDKDKTDK
jgi:hypothetical protein